MSELTWETEADRIAGWQEDQFVRILNGDLCEAQWFLARRIDYHDLERLLAGGCSVATAKLILHPLP